MLVDKLYQRTAHTHRTVLRTQQHIGIGVSIMDLEEELRLALVILHQVLMSFTIVSSIAPSLTLMVNFSRRFSLRLEILHSANLEVEVVGIAVTGYALRGNEDGAASYHDAAPVAQSSPKRASSPSPSNPRW